MIQYLFVFIGGGLGSICRFGIGHWLVNSRLSFPWATLSANFLSCMLLGMLLSISIKGKISDNWSVFFMAGFCGGFSTFSTFTSEFFQMLHTGLWAKAFFYAGISLLVCVFSLVIGMKIIH